MQHVANTISTEQGVDQRGRTQTTKSVSKKGTLISLLSNPKGARVLSLCKVLGWQKHTVRAAVSGLRASGYVIESHPSSRDGVTVYRITQRPYSI
mgnify:CR=1 FL=1